jgi:outer membrane protein assembly factor BamB
LCSPTIGPDGRIWLHKWNDRPYAGFDNGSSIRQIWAASSTIYSCFSDPSLYQDALQLLVISGGRTDRITAWDGLTGAEVWSVWMNNGLPTDSTATVDPDTGNIYISYGFDDIYIVGLDKAGQSLWQNTAMQVHDSQSGAYNPQRCMAPGCLSYDGSTYYFQTNSSNGSGSLFAIDTSDGSVKWSYPTQSRGWEIHSSVPIVTKNGIIVVGNNEGDTYWALLDDGSDAVLLDSYTVATDGTAQAGATVSPDGFLYLPMRTTWTVSNGDGETPSGNVENVFTAFSLQ